MSGRNRHEKAIEWLVCEIVESREKDKSHESRAFAL